MADFPWAEFLGIARVDPMPLAGGPEDAETHCDFTDEGGPDNAAIGPTSGPHRVHSRTAEIHCCREEVPPDGPNGLGLCLSREENEKSGSRAAGETQPPTVTRERDVGTEIESIGSTLDPDQGCSCSEMSNRVAGTRTNREEQQSTSCQPGNKRLEELELLEVPQRRVGRPVIVRGQKGWTLPGRMPKGKGLNVPVLVTDPLGESHLVERGQVKEVA